MSSGKNGAKSYYPPPEAQGGWRVIKDLKLTEDLVGMKPDRLQMALETQLLIHGGDSWGIVIIRNGYLVAECYTFNVLHTTCFDIWSCTKSFTGALWGLLLEDGARGELPAGRRVNLDSPIYPFISVGHPLSDSHKEAITVGQLLTMTSGIPGEAHGVIGMPTSTENGPFEHALGKCPNRYGRLVDKLYCNPGQDWDYSDPAIAHLALAFQEIMGREMHELLNERVIHRIGIESFWWDIQGGSGFIGPHTNAHTGIHITAREMSRFGYLHLRQGKWKDQQVLPESWITMATSKSQDYKPTYGYTYWVNTDGTCWQDLPRDSFAMSGYRSNRCYVIPSLDLVVSRVGSGPPDWDEQKLIGDIVSSIK